MGEISQDLVRHLFTYDPETGSLTWRNPRSPSVKAGSRAGNVTREGRVQLGIGGKMYRAHRVIWLYMTGSWPADIIDHIDGNATNNAWDNLRVANKSGNSVNTLRRSTNQSGFKGVSPSGRKWVAHLTVSGKVHYLGTFPTKEEAAEAYDTAARRHHGQFAKTNAAMGLL